MTSLVRKATLSVCCLMVAGAAMAAVPDATNSWATKSSPCLVLVGDWGAGNAAPKVTNTIACIWTIQVLDGAAIPNPIPNAIVRIDFQDPQLVGRIHVATQPSQQANVTLPSPMTVDPSIKSVSVTANGSGIATFQIEGCGNNTNYLNTGIPGGLAIVSANNTTLGGLTVAVLNQNAANAAGGFPGTGQAVTAADATVVLTQLLPAVPAQPYKSVSDINCDNATTAVDASIILQHVVLPGAWPPGGPSQVCPPMVLVPLNNAPGYAW